METLSKSKGRDLNKELIKVSQLITDKVSSFNSSILKPNVVSLINSSIRKKNEGGLNRSRTLDSNVSSQNSRRGDDHDPDLPQVSLIKTKLKSYTD